MKTLKLFAVVFLAAQITACANHIEVSGYGFTDSHHEDVVVGKTTRHELISNLGSPTAVANIGDDKKVYYISRKTKRVAFLDPIVLEQQVLAISLDKNNVVSGIEELTLDDSKHVVFSENHTLLRGNEITAMQQIMGNLGKYNVPNENKEE